MRHTRGALWTGALALAWLWTGSAHAGWDNVFQVTCWRCRKKEAPVASYYYAPPAACGTCAPPQPTCTTNYVQRCYYQPVTHYETRSYYESVTSYKTSYYCEPVTTMRYSCYFDPCTCSYQQVATPTTSYRLREQTCPVQSWVQRCMSVPVTAYQQSFYWEPVTSCCTPPAPVTSCCTPAAPAPSCCGTPAASLGSPAAPAVGEQLRPATPGVNEYPPRTNSDGYQQRSYPPQQTAPPPVNNSTQRQSLPNFPTTQPATQRVRLDRIASSDNVTQTGVRLRLVSEDRALAAR